jgi:hypothetical protein
MANATASTWTRHICKLTREPRLKCDTRLWYFNDISTGRISLKFQRKTPVSLARALKSTQKTLSKLSRICKVHAPDHCQYDVNRSRNLPWGTSLCDCLLRKGCGTRGSL